MSRMIDADKLKRKMQKIATETWKMKLTGGIRVETIWNQAIDLIDTQPTIDKWNPVSLNPPYEEKTYLIQTDNGYMCLCRWTNKNRIYSWGKTVDWHWNYMDIPQYTQIVAWMEKPEEYKVNN